MNQNHDDLPIEIKTGIEIFNEGFYFDAHEIMELRWVIDKSKFRNLYRGLIQLSAAFYHLDRGNTRGAIKLLKMAEENLAPYKNDGYSFDLPELLNEIQKLRAQISNSTANGSVINQFGLIDIKIKILDKS